MNVLQIVGRFVLRSFDYLVRIFSVDKSVYCGDKVLFNQKILDKIDVLIEDFEHVFDKKLVNNIIDFYKVETNIGQDENWKAYPFLLYNHTFEKNLKECPNVSKLLEEIPECTSAMFSILKGGKHITPHKGIYKGVIRILFPLIVPQNGVSWIKIDGQKYIFERGKGFYFDETYEHEVKNESEELRVALFLDIYRGFSFSLLNFMNKVIFKLLQESYFMKEKVKNYQSLTKTEVKLKRQLKGYCFE